MASFWACFEAVGAVWRNFENSYLYITHIPTIFPSQISKILQKCIFPQMLCVHTQQYIHRTMQQSIARETMIQGQRQRISLIDQVVLVGLSRHCKLRPDSHQLKWITSLRIATRRQIDARQDTDFSGKDVEIGNDLFLQLRFCETGQRPITKLKNCIRNANNEENVLPWPVGVVGDQVLLAERGGEGRIIQDLQMVEVSGDRELELPQEESYEVVRLPTACQTVPEQNSSNEQLIEKTRYLLVRTLDIDDHAAIMQSFQPEVTLRHAFYPSLVLDSNTFPDFIFPEGVPLIAEIFGTGYQVFSFILTQEDNSRLYVNCLKFKERLPAQVVQTLPPNCVDKHLRERTHLYAERAFCIVSKFCHTDFFHNLLEEVFRQYLTLHNSLAMRAKLEVKSQGCIPYLQTEMGFQKLVDQFIASYEWGLLQAQRQMSELQYMRQSVKIQMQWFGQRFCFPEPLEQAATLFSPRAVHCLFAVLSVDKVAQVFLALLQERKVFFVSDSQVVLGYVIEALISFLYPLRWQHLILPILPQKLLQLLEAPMPLLAGIPTALATDDLICSAKQTTVVFLDCNQVISKDRYVQIKEVNHLREAVKRLRTYDIYQKDHVVQMLSLREQFFLFRIHEKQTENTFSAQHIKHIFFETMLLFLQNYNKFYLPSATGAQFNFKRDYQVQDFVKSHPKSLQRFMKRLTQCTHFINFIYKYQSKTAHKHKGIIDRVLQSQKNSRSPSPIKQEAFRLSEQPAKNNTQINNLRKKVSLQPHPHNTTWSPPPKKSEEVSTNYSRNFERCSIRLEDVQCQKQKSEIRPSFRTQQRKTKGGQICETITKAMTNASHTKRNVIIWTQARVARLKRIFTGSSKEGREVKTATDRNEMDRQQQKKQQGKEH